MGRSRWSLGAAKSDRLLENGYDLDSAPAFEGTKHLNSDLEGPLARLHDQLFALSRRAPESWSTGARRMLLAEVESYRRLNVLLTELDRQFAVILAKRSSAWSV